MSSDCIENNNIAAAFILIIGHPENFRRMRLQFIRRGCMKSHGGSRSVIPDPTLLPAALHVIRVFNCTPVSSHLQSWCCAGVMVLMGLCVCGMIVSGLS